MKKINRDQSGKLISWTFIYNTLLNKLEFYDPAFESFLRTNNAEQTKNYFLNVLPDNIPLFTNAWNKCMHLKDKEQYFFQATLKDINENLYFFDICASCLQTSSGENTFRILFTGTEDKQYEESEIRKTEESIDLHKKWTEEFVFLAVHDLNAPVRKLSSLMDIFISKTTDELNTKYVGYIKRMETVLKQLTALIESLSVLHEISGKADLADTCDLNGLLHEILDEMNTILKPIDVNINVGALPVIKGNSRELKLLFQNLIYNAVNFRNENKPLQIELLSKTLLPEEQIDYNLPLDRIFYEITITDNGMGFSTQQTDAIFQPFRRLHGQKFGGSGLGLTICQKIVQNHFGILYAKAAETEGAQFIIILPK